jgi:hypothetical protein
LDWKIIGVKLLKFWIKAKANPNAINVCVVLRKEIVRNSNALATIVGYPQLQGDADLRNVTRQPKHTECT